MSNTDSSTPAGSSKGLILVVVSSESLLPLKNGRTFSTGYYLNELSVPVKHLMDAGYEVDFANPKGNAPALDRLSDSPRFFGGDEVKYAEIKAFHDSLTKLRKPLTLEDVIDAGLDRYVAIFVPGGQAPMTDLMESAELGQILRTFHREQKLTALVCHGPIALASAADDPASFKEALLARDFDKAQSFSSTWPYRGYQTTIFSTTEEIIVEPNLGGETQFWVETALQTLGATVSVTQQWQSKVVQDRELITGQNPFSDEEFAEALLKALGERTR